MIQRKQSIWLFIAALLGSGVFYFSLYKYSSMVTPPGATQPVATEMQLRVMNHYPSVLIAVVMTLLPLVTIFMYTNRKRQIAMSVANILAISSFITMTLTRINKITPPPTDGSYSLGAILPAAAMIFTILAIFGIRRDDKLVKSMDRLR